MYELRESGWAKRMKCVRCEIEIDGDVRMCSKDCMCGGKEGRITKGSEIVGRICGDTILHPNEDYCIIALKHRVAALEAHT
jgi:hypothetical protein